MSKPDPNLPANRMIAKSVTPRLRCAFFIAMSLLCQAEDLSSQSKLPPTQFDFGPAGGAVPNEYVRITPKTKYTKEMGYGLLTDSLGVFTTPALMNPLGVEVADGLKKEGAIGFRVDVPKGKYFIEIVMAGGIKKTWEGEISVNGKKIVDQIGSFGYSAESEYAPPYWAVMRGVENDTTQLIIRVETRTQPSTIASIMIYSGEAGPILFVDGAFKRSTGAEAPNTDLALRLINTGKVKEALRIIDAIPDEWRYERAHLLFAVASRLETEAPRQCVESAYALLEEEYRNNPTPQCRFNLRLAQLYLRADRHFKQAGWQWARDYNGMGIFGNCEISGISSEEVTYVPQHPLWLRATWHLAKTCYWLWVEQGGDHMIDKADFHFKHVQEYYPRYQLLRAYLGEYDTPRFDNVDTTRVPLWASLQNMAANRLKDVIHYWTENRQAVNGEFGGKYDDDVEMLRWWPFARVAFDDSITLVGMKRLVDGIWNSGWIENGWSKKVRDVEHSSEPVADTQPMMIGLDYGNPVYVERCMQSLKLALELWTAKNTYGHRHFKSSWYSSTAMDTDKPKDCDVSYNTRTVKAIRWLAWYNRHPQALKFLKEWGDSWLEDCMRTDKGKPKGIVPAALRFSDDAIGGHADNWHHPGMFWGYYDYRGGSDMLMELLTDYLLFKDAKYLQPIEMSLELIRAYRTLREKPKDIGSEPWTAYILMHSNGFWEVVELWRLMTANKRYDDLLAEAGSAYMKYRLTSQERYLHDGVRGLLRDVHNNFPLITTEGYFTDRIEIRDLRAHENKASALLESMYLGAPLLDLFYPFSPIFWKGFDTTFSALVLNASPTSIAVKVFNHSSSVKRGEISFLQFERGRYLSMQGSDTNHDGAIENIARLDTLNITQRNSSWPVSFAPQKEELLVVKELAAASLQETAVCDLAVTASELRVMKKSRNEVEVTLPVHNIGTLGAANVLVEVLSVGSITKVLQQAAIVRIDAPLDMLPKSERVSFTLQNARGQYKIRVSLRSGGQEITDVNNAVQFSL